MKRMKRKITAVVLGICLAVVSVVSVPVYAGTPDAPIVTVTPNTATSSWTNQSATVSFVVPQYTVTAGYCANGSVTVSKSQAVATDTVVVTAIPNANYELEYVVINGASIGKAGSFEMPAQDTTVQAHFKQSGYVVFDPSKGIVGGWRAGGQTSHHEPGEPTRSSEYSIPLLNGAFQIVRSYEGAGGSDSKTVLGAVWTTEEIDLSLYNTLYIEAATIIHRHGATPQLHLGEYDRPYGEWIRYDSIKDSDIELDYGGGSVNGVPQYGSRKVYEIDVSSMTKKIQPVIATGMSEGRPGSQFTYNIKIHKIWFA